jgi:hypothetical protein
LLPRTPDNVPAALREKVSAEAVAIVDARRTQRLTQGKGKGGVELRARYLGDMEGKFTRVTSMLGGASHLLLQRKGAFNTKSRRLEPADIELGLEAAKRKAEAKRKYLFLSIECRGLRKPKKHSKDKEAVEDGSLQTFVVVESFSEETKLWTLIGHSEVSAMGEDC